jgi:hypothetical protein
MPAPRFHAPKKKPVQGNVVPGKGIPDWIRVYGSDESTEAEGFVYLIVNLVNGEFYIGKKLFWKSAKHCGKKARIESDWRTYWGSSKDVKAALKKYGHSNFCRYILQTEQMKCQLNLLELMYQLHYFTRPRCMNKILNIRLYKFPQMLGVHMKVDLDNYLNFATVKE